MKKLLPILAFSLCTVILKAQLGNQFMPELKNEATQLSFNAVEAKQIVFNIQFGDMAKVKELIGRNGPAVLNHSEAGYAVIHWLIEKKHLDEEILQLLVDRGANINQVDNRGITPLLAAARGGQGGHGSLEATKSLVEILMNAGVDPFINTSTGETIIRGVALSPFLSKEDKLEIIAMLREYRALYQEAQQNPSLETLRKAIELGRWALVKQLVTQLALSLVQIKELDQLAYGMYKQSHKNSYRIVNKILTSLVIQNIKLQKYFPDLPKDIISIAAAKSFGRRNAHIQSNQNQSILLTHTPVQHSKRKHLDS